ncbi:acyltransferase family protein [Roseomonas sp. E05]|uniref:acyltransferase family protein n=1 Tax=Roseomonas sp. E05 TaxID=3046310 RepID=UPI0024B8CE3C|nr:acyltransferase family protein [Roseomonas sp. E05]MDJ0391471.1 acyltransferase family protein [Roseomonas sp. E05]
MISSAPSVPPLRPAVASLARFLRSVRIGKQITPRVSGVLDLSRWVAAALVLVFHLGTNVLMPWAELPVEHRGAWQALLYALLNCGDQAVLWFFVSSGFLVGGGVLASIQARSFVLAGYAVNRTARIYAVLIPALVLGYVLDGARIFQYGLGSAGQETPEAYTAWAVLSNLLCLQTLVAPPLGSNRPLWSLAYEVWYYALFPLLLAPFWARGRGMVAALAGAAAILAFLLVFNPGMLGSFLVWLLGVAARVCPWPLLRSQRGAWLLAALAALAYPFLLPLLPSGAVKLLVGIAFASTLLATRFSRNDGALPFAEWHALFAGFSYSLYLVHAPILHSVLTFLQGRADPELRLLPAGLAPLLWGVSLFVLLAVCGYVFSCFTEAHTDRLRVALTQSLGLRRRPG